MGEDVRRVVIVVPGAVVLVVVVDVVAGESLDPGAAGDDVVENVVDTDVYERVGEEAGYACVRHCWSLVAN